MIVDEGNALLDRVAEAAAQVPLPALETATPVVLNDSTKHHLTVWVVTAQEFLWHLSYHCVWTGAPDVYKKASSLFGLDARAARIKYRRLLFDQQDITERTVSALADMTMDATRQLVASVLASVKNAMTASRFALLLKLTLVPCSSWAWRLLVKVRALNSLFLSSRVQVCLAPWWTLDPTNRRIADGVQGCLAGVRPCPFAVDWTRPLSASFSRDCYDLEFVPDLHRMPLGIVLSSTRRHADMEEMPNAFWVAVHHMLEDGLLWVVHSIMHVHPWRWSNGCLFIDSSLNGQDCKDAASVTWYTLRWIEKIFRCLSRRHLYPCACHGEHMQISLTSIVARLSFIILRQVWDGPQHFAPQRLAKFVLACKDHQCLSNDLVAQWCLHQCLVHTGMWASKPRMSLTCVMTTVGDVASFHGLMALTWKEHSTTWRWEVLEHMRRGIAHLVHCIQASTRDWDKEALLGRLWQLYHRYFPLTADVSLIIDLPDISDSNGPNAQLVRDMQQDLVKLQVRWSPLRKEWVHTVVRFCTFVAGAMVAVPRDGPLRFRDGVLDIVSRLQ